MSVLNFFIFIGSFALRRQIQRDTGAARFTWTIWESTAQNKQVSLGGRFYLDPVRLTRRPSAKPAKRPLAAEDAQHRALGPALLCIPQADAEKLSRRS